MPNRINTRLRFIDDTPYSKEMIETTTTLPGKSQSGSSNDLATTAAYLSAPYVQGGNTQK
jgi:hypothetical protein